MSQTIFDKVADSIAKDHPSFKIRYKDESRLMRLLALLVYPFNDGFMDGYVTTLGSVVYFPSRAHVERDYAGSAVVLAHEGVHVFDAQHHGLWFMISYALNQAALLPLLVAFAVLGSWIPVAVLVGGVAMSYMGLAAARALTESRGVRRGVFFILSGLSVVSYLGLSVWLAGGWVALAVAAFAPLAPVTSRWRAKWEYRGYAMNIAMQYWRFGSVSDRFLENRVMTFTGPDYYFMDRDTTRVLDTLKDIRASVLDGTILIGGSARPYQRTHAVLNELGLLKMEAVGA